MNKNMHDDLIEAFNDWGKTWNEVNLKDKDGEECYIVSRLIPTYSNLRKINSKKKYKVIYVLKKFNEK